MKFRNFENLLLEGEPESALAGTPAAPVVPAQGVAVEPVSTDSIYGDLQVKFPEGMDEGLREEPSLKAFVDKESGELNYSNLMKSYVHGQKQVGVNKTVIPNENSTDQELNEFWTKLGFNSDESEYTVNRGEEALMSEDQMANFKKFAMENRLPVKTAQKLADYMEAQTKEGVTSSATAQAAAIEEGLGGLQTEWGQAYEQKLGVAQRVLKEVVASDEVMEAFRNPVIGSNPVVIKMLESIGSKLFKEDGIQGAPTNNGMRSPSEASEEINAIMGDDAGPYWNSSHPSHKDEVAKVLKLREMANGGRI